MGLLLHLINIFFLEDNWQILQAMQKNSIQCGMKHRVALEIIIRKTLGSIPGLTVLFSLVTKANIEFQRMLVITDLIVQYFLSLLTTQPEVGQGLPP